MSMRRAPSASRWRDPRQTLTAATRWSSTFRFNIRRPPQRVLSRSRFCQLRSFIIREMRGTALQAF